MTAVHVIHVIHRIWVQSQEEQRKTKLQRMEEAQ